MARSVGLKKDIRLSKKNHYSNYNSLIVKSFIGLNGDCFDRYLIRMLEMGESLNICNSIIQKMLNSRNSMAYHKLITKNLKKKSNQYTYMEDVIEHFLN
jgi:NADH-quinone oxidoreductase subunit D